MMFWMLASKRKFLLLSFFSLFKMKLRASFSSVLKKQFKSNLSEEMERASKYKMEGKR